VGPELRVPAWSSVVASLLATGSAQIKGAVAPDHAEALYAASREPWVSAPPEEGHVRQTSFASHSVLDAADPDVRALAEEIVGCLTGTRWPGLPSVPAFNEVSWSRYPAGQGHITAHRDPLAYGGVIAIVTLVGRAPFRVWGGDVDGRPAEVLAGDEAPQTWLAEAGDLVLLRGNGWLAAGTRSPVHEVDRPIGGERVSMTFRFNTRGAGGGYEVDTP
jgi:hypothetical protein